MARNLLLERGHDPEVKMNNHILIVDDETEFLLLVKRFFAKKFRISTAASYQDAKSILEGKEVDYVLLDISLGEENGLDYIKKIKEVSPQSDIIMITGHKDPKLMIDAIRLGASDYLVKPFELEEVVAIIEKLTPHRVMREQHSALLKNLNESFDDKLIIGRSEYLIRQLEQAQKLKGRKANVLIEGESGTGKELFARYIHRLENCDERPFIAINCAAIPDALLEAELFGSEKGSFTSSTERKIGKFELANGGDLFLDEVSSLKLDLQAKILRAIAEQEITRIGGTQTIKVDFRVIAASNENLEQLVEAGQFRRDLFHRLRVVSLNIPPLRERREDIPILADSFLKKYAKEPSWAFARSAMIALTSYDWPGNVRELENLIQSLVILVEGPNITVSDLPEWLFLKQQSVFTSSPYFTKNTGPSHLNECIPLKTHIAKIEEDYVRQTIELANGDKSKAAAVLQISRTRLYERLRLWGMVK